MRGRGWGENQYARPSGCELLYFCNSEQETQDLPRFFINRYFGVFERSRATTGIKQGDFGSKMGCFVTVINTQSHFSYKNGQAGRSLGKY